MSRGMSKVFNFTFIFNLKLDNGASGGVSLISKSIKQKHKKNVMENTLLHFLSGETRKSNREALINPPPGQLTCVMVDEVGLPLVCVGLLPVRGQGPQTIVIRGVGVTRVSVVLRDALPAAAACIVRTHS